MPGDTGGQQGHNGDRRGAGGVGLPVAGGAGAGRSLAQLPGGDRPYLHLARGGGAGSHRGLTGTIIAKVVRSLPQQTK